MRPAPGVVKQFQTARQHRSLWGADIDPYRLSPRPTGRRTPTRMPARRKCTRCAPRSAPTCGSGRRGGSSPRPGPRPRPTDDLQLRRRRRRVLRRTAATTGTTQARCSSTTATTAESPTRATLAGQLRRPQPAQGASRLRPRQPRVDRQPAGPVVAQGPVRLAAVAHRRRRWRSALGLVRRRRAELQLQPHPHLDLRAGQGARRASRAAIAGARGARRHPTALASLPVTLWEKRHGASRWVRVGSHTTNRYGNVRWSRTHTTAYDYRVRMPGQAPFAPSNYARPPSASAEPGRRTGSRQSIAGEPVEERQHHQRSGQHHHAQHDQPGQRARAQVGLPAAVLQPAQHGRSVRRRNRPQAERVREKKLSRIRLNGN